MSGSEDGRRVAFVLTQDRGGPVDVTVELAAAVNRLPGWEARVFGPTPARGAERIADLHTEIRVESKGAAGALRAARGTVLDWQPNVVHGQDRRSGLICSTLHVGRSAGRRPVVVHTYHGVPDDVAEPWFRGSSRGGPSTYTRAVLAADALLARRMARTVVPASTMGRFLQQRLHVPVGRVVHIDNGMPLPPAAPPSGPVRKLLFVGLLVKRKGVHTLLAAMSGAVLPPGVVLRIVGDGPERAALEAQASDLRLDERVEFLGFRSDVPDLLVEADAFVLPSEMEQQPLVLIEAMGAGKPIVATDVGGVAEMVGDAGLVVQPGDPAALGRTLAELTSRTTVREMGDRAATRARDRFSVERARDAHCALYESLLLEGRGYTS